MVSKVVSYCLSFSLHDFVHPYLSSSCVWHPGSAPQLVSIDEKQLSLFKIGEDSAKVHVSADSAIQVFSQNSVHVLQVHSSIVLDSKGRSSHSSLCWNPHHNSSQVLCSVDGVLKAWDTRANQ